MIESVAYQFEPPKKKRGRPKKVVVEKAVAIAKIRKKRLKEEMIEDENAPVVEELPLSNWPFPCSAHTDTAQV